MLHISRFVSIAVLAHAAGTPVAHAQCVPQMANDMQQWSQKGDEAFREGLAKCATSKEPNCRGTRQLLHDRYDDTLFQLSLMQGIGDRATNSQAMAWKRVGGLLEKIRTP